MRGSTRISIPSWYFESNDRRSHQHTATDSADHRYYEKTTRMPEMIERPPTMKTVVLPAELTWNNSERDAEDREDMESCGKWYVKARGTEYPVFAPFFFGHNTSDLQTIKQDSEGVPTTQHN